MSTQPKFRLFSAVLATVCLILVGDAIAPTAAIGNSQYIWWLIMILGFFIPYGLISAELSAQRPSPGGIYTWVKQAFGPKWASRVAWFYWVNFPLWIAALANLVTSYLMRMLGFEITWPIILALQIFYIALVSILGCLRVSQNYLFNNLSAIAKIIFMLGLGGLGIYVFITHGTANPIYSPGDILPFVGANGFSLVGLGFISLIIFNVLGFEVVSTFANEMQNPQKEIPKAIIYGGILITIFYLLSSFGINVALPTAELNVSTGLIDSYAALLGSLGLSAGAIQACILIIGGLFIYTLIANVSAWSFGVNSTIAHAAEDGTFPKSWTKRNSAGVPYIISTYTGIVAAIISVIGILCVELTNQDPTLLFWTFFLLSLVCLFFTYLPMFLAFWKLHRQGPVSQNSFWIKGSSRKIAFYSFAPFSLLLIALFFALFPEFNLDMFEYQLPIFVGLCIIIIVGEVMINLYHPEPKITQPITEKQK